MSGGSSQVRDDSMLEEGEIHSPGTAAAASVLLEMNAIGDGNREMGNRNHEPVTDEANGAGQSVEGSIPTHMDLVQGVGVTGTPPVVMGHRPLLSARQTANIGSTSLGVSQGSLQGSESAQGAALASGRGQDIIASMQGSYFPMDNPPVYRPQQGWASGQIYDYQRGGWFIPARPPNLGAGQSHGSTPTSEGNFMSPPRVQRQRQSPLTVHRRVTARTMFHYSRKAFDCVDGKALRDEDRIATDRRNAFSKGIKKFETRMDVRRWVEAFKRGVRLSGLTNNPKLILQTLLDKIDAETNVGEGVHTKYDSLQTQRYEARLRVNGFNEDEALAYSYGNEALEDYVCALLDHVMVARAAKLNETHLDDKWNALKMKPRQSLQSYFAKMETQCVQIRAIGGNKTTDEQVKALLNGLPQSTSTRSGDLQVSLPGEARKEIERAKAAQSVTYLENPLAYVQLFLQNQVTNFKLRMKISDDDSDDESEEEEERLKKTVRFTKSQGDFLGEKGKLKDEAQLRELVGSLQSNQMSSKPCELCLLIPGRAKFAKNHSASVCWQNPLCNHFEPKVGFDRSGKERKKRTLKRKEREAKRGNEPEPKRQKGEEAKEVRFTQAEWEAKAKETAEKKAAEFEASMKAWTEKSGQMLVPKQEYEKLAALRRTMLEKESAADKGCAGVYEWQSMSGKN